MSIQIVKTIVFNFIILIVLLFFIEVTLLLVGIKPISNYFPSQAQIDLINLESDSVTQLPFYYPDTLGVQKIRLIDYDRKNNNNGWYIELYNYLKTIKFNEDGYRGNSFKNIPNNKKRVMFIGDSYVFGYEAEPITNSFVDIIQRMDSNLYCLNLGVGSTDLAGYEAIAKYYIPRLNPNIVVCCIYVNDFVYYDKKQKAYEVNDYYMCYEGVLAKEDVNNNKYVKVYNTANGSYFNLKNKLNSIDNLRKNFITNFLCNYSRIYSYLSPYKKKYMEAKNDYKIYDKKNCSKKYISSISNLCKQYNSQFLIFLIPDLYNENKITDLDFFKNKIDTNLYLYYPNKINASHYNGIHQHFNNKGYQFYADFIYSVIDTLNY